METTEQRLFFALWPAPHVQAALSRIPEGLSRARGRPSHRDDLHVTLVFLGNVAAERLACVEQAAAQLRSEPFELHIDQLGYWSGSRILWCAPSTTPEPLVQLVRDLRERLKGCGFKPERRHYAVHITLMRHARPQPPRALEQPISWPVQDFALVASTLGGPPPRCRLLRRWPLAPVAATTVDS
jgi:2'-5' RNA ligase